MDTTTDLTAFRDRLRAQDKCIAVLPVGDSDAVFAFGIVIRRTRGGIVTSSSPSTLPVDNIFPPTDGGLSLALKRRVRLLQQFRAEHERAIAAIDNLLAAAVSPAHLTQACAADP